jgi:hypothetical protein
MNRKYLMTDTYGRHALECKHAVTKIEANEQTEIIAEICLGCGTIVDEWWVGLFIGLVKFLLPRLLNDFT